MRANFQKNGVEWNMFADFWRLLQAYGAPETEDAYWDELHTKVTEFADKYKNEEKALHDLSCTLGVALYNYVDEKAKELEQELEIE